MNALKKIKKQASDKLSESTNTIKTKKNKLTKTVSDGIEKTKTISKSTVKKISEMKIPVIREESTDFSSEKTFDTSTQEEIDDLLPRDSKKDMEAKIEIAKAFRKRKLPHTKGEGNTPRPLPFFGTSLRKFKDQNHNLSLGTILYFDFNFRIIFWVAIMSILALVSVLLNYSNSESTFKGCPRENTEPDKASLMRTTLGNIPGGNAVVQILMSYALILVSIFFLRNLYKNTSKIICNYVLERKVTSLSDRTVFVQNIPKSVTSRTKIAEFFSKFGVVSHVVYPKNYRKIYDTCQEIYDLKRMRVELNLKEEKTGKKAFGHSVAPGFLKAKGLGRDVEWIDEKIEDLDGKITKILEKKSKLFKKKKKRADYIGCAYITFETIEMAALCLATREKWYTKWIPFFGGKLVWKRNRLRVERAPEPDDLIWKNLGISRLSRQIRSLFIWAILGCIVTASIAILGSLTYLQEDNEQFAIIISFIITIFNVILEYAIDMLVGMEKNHSKSSEEASKLFFKLISTSLNQFLFLFISYWGNKNFWKETSDIVLYSTIIESLRTVVISIIKRRAMDWWGLRSARKKSFSLFGLKESYHPKLFELSSFYASIFRIVNQTFLFFFGWPLITIISLVFLSLTYFVNKWFLLRNLVESHKYTEAIQSKILALLPFLLIFHAVCNLVVFMRQLEACDTQELGVTDTSVFFLILILIFIAIGVAIAFQIYGIVVRVKLFKKKTKLVRKETEDVEDNLYIEKKKSYRPPYRTKAVVEFQRKGKNLNKDVPEINENLNQENVPSGDEIQKLELESKTTESDNSSTSSGSDSD
ncbi:putative membrane protein [Anaeramoeba flamelloides]|uniref:Membrane protein n=1 Tax=Anaeramoeba flamelloides TaxID=1746091 RepID=A0ABQ8ZFA9_9EUKA|nr:putative membrane protein [Anaeramoeba flamelloides]